MNGQSTPNKTGTQRKKLKNFVSKNIAQLKKDASTKLARYLNVFIGIQSRKNLLSLVIFVTVFDFFFKTQNSNTALIL
jgi:hypothetical protein